MRKLIVLVPFLLSVLFPVVAAQVAGNPENWCREGFFTRDSTEFSIATVKGGRTTRAYFFKDDREECPGSPSCRARAFVVGGDEVVVNRSRSGYSCAWYEPKVGRPTIGWLKTSDLTFPGAGVEMSAGSWLGNWAYAGNSLEFIESDVADTLDVSGNAIWRGIGDNVHVGEIEGRYKPQNGVIEHSTGDDEYDCKATLRLLGRYLIVADNLRCGGLNVSFSGVYSRRR